MDTANRGSGDPRFWRGDVGLWADISAPERVSDRVPSRCRPRPSPAGRPVLRVSSGDTQANRGEWTDDDDHGTEHDPNHP